MVSIAFATGWYKQSKDSLYLFLKECLARNWEVYWFIFDEIKKKKNKPYATLYKLDKKSFRITKKHTYTYTKKEEWCLEDLDVVFLKRDPPLPIKQLNLIKDLNKKTLVMNNPKGILKYLSNDHLLKFKEFTPPTFFSKNIQTIKRYIRNLKNCVLKEEFSLGGFGVHHIYQEEGQYYVDNKKKDHVKIDLDSYLKILTKNQTQIVTVMKYLTNVSAGDKRILCVGGKMMPPLLRKPLKGGWLCNVKSGGLVEKSAISAREKKMVKSIAPKLLKDGIFFVGFDTLEDGDGTRYLSEINPENPGTFQFLKKLYKIDIGKVVIDCVEKEYKKRKRSL